MPDNPRASEHRCIENLGILLAILMRRKSCQKQENKRCRRYSVSRALRSCFTARYAEHAPSVSLRLPSSPEHGSGERERESDVRRDSLIMRYSETSIRLCRWDRGMR
ncbi:hypothetical protein DPX16_3138 [Anabarilius grahami]|uniref:Uncharacterized protein n=1 Tax=Anabarilius grahami TaxID=495550 RepID=A0A3N0YYT7_ANAGA|nr:hypothetical protein DPX16_3138 [Anabarilius grahami]